MYIKKVQIKSVLFLMTQFCVIYLYKKYEFVDPLKVEEQIVLKATFWILHLWEIKSIAALWKNQPHHQLHVPWVAP